MMRKTIKLLGVALLGTALMGCSPFIDSRREAGQTIPVGQSRKNRPAICYNPLWTGDETLQSMADEACAAIGKKAVFDEKEYFNCRLIAPNTAFFKCR